MRAPTNVVPLGEVVELNPRLNELLKPNELVSFVPMAAVTEVTGEIVREELRQYSEVANGFTPFKSDDVIVAKITPCFQNGKIAHANLSKRWGFGSTEFHVVRADLKWLFPRYAFHFLRQEYIRVAGERRMTGSAGQRRVPANYFAQLPIPLPPLSEQKRIAEILDRAEALRAKRRAALALLDELTQSIFLDMFGDPVTNPRAWPIRVFDDVCESRLGKMLDGKKQIGDNLRPYMRNINVQWGRLDLSTVWKMDFNVKDREEFRLLPNDVLICEGGAGVAQTAIWRGEISDCYFQKSLHRVRPRRELATSEYIAYLIRLLMREGSELFRLVSSATIPHLTGVKLKTLKIPLPPITMQRKWDNVMELIAHQKAQIQSHLSNLDQLFASLQHRAFRGEL